MTPEQARDIVLDALATYRHVHVTSANAIGPDGLVIDFTDGTMGRLDITIYPNPAGDAS